MGARWLRSEIYEVSDLGRGSVRCYHSRAFFDQGVVQEERVHQCRRGVFWEPAGLGLINVDCVFFADFGKSQWLGGASEEFWNLGRGCEDILIPTMSFELSGVDLLRSQGNRQPLL